MVHRNVLACGRDILDGVQIPRSRLRRRQEDLQRNDTSMPSGWAEYSYNCSTAIRSGENDREVPEDSARKLLSSPVPLAEDTTRLENGVNHACSGAYMHGAVTTTSMHRVKKRMGFGRPEIRDLPRRKQLNYV